MKIQSDPHGDMGSQAEMIWPLIEEVGLCQENRWVVTTVPKVGMPLRRRRGAAPRIGDDAVSSRLYAGKSVVSSTTRYLNCIDTARCTNAVMSGSDNVRGADNQQERLWNPENPQRPYADCLVVNAAR